MSLVVPIDIPLGPARTGSAIGSTVYQLDGTTVFSAFSVAGWSESPAGTGDWHNHPGVTVPDVGGVVSVGISGTEYKRFAVDFSVAGAVFATPLTEPSSAFSWSGATFMRQVAWMAALIKNKFIQTGSLQTLRNDADSADIATATTSDSAGTFTKNKWS